jgi:hypothetical protein
VRRAEGLSLSAISTPTPQHRSTSALPPLCAGKPLLTCSQVECPSRCRSEPQSRAMLTPAHSCLGHLTPPPYSPQAAIGAIFHRPSPSPDHPSMNITESRSPSMTTPSPTSSVSLATLRRPPPPKPQRHGPLYTGDQPPPPLQPLESPLHPTGILLGRIPRCLAAPTHRNPATTATACAMGHRSPVSDFGRPVLA